MERILVIDDDLVTLVLSREVLAAGGYEVETFDSALAVAAEYRPGRADLIVSDFMMPQLNGGEFLRVVRKIDPDVPFLVLTSINDVNVTVELFKDGASDYLLKPINPKDLLNRVARALEASRIKRELARVNHEKTLAELENQKLVNWRKLYAYKDIAQTEQMINLLSRTINAEGGYLWLDLLKDLPVRDDGTTELPGEMKDLIVRSAESQRSVFDFLGFISRLPTMKLNLETVPGRSAATDLAAFARGELDALVQADKRNLQIHISYLDFPGTVTVDRSYIRKILRELVVNALKYSPPDSRIHLEMARGRPQDIAAGVPATGHASDDCLAVLVRNLPRQLKATDQAGKPIEGIPYDYSELVFDLFFTIESFPVTHPAEEWADGTGLYVSRKLMRRMGGWIEQSTVMDHLGARPTAMVQFALLIPLDKTAP